LTQQFWSHWAWPLATAVLGLVFAALVIRQWQKRRKPHQAAWSVGLLFYAAAAVMEFWSSYTNAWNQTAYRIYIVLAASLVGFLGLGTLYLLTRRRIWGHMYLAFTLVCLIVFLVGVFTAPLDGSRLQPGITVGGAPLGGSLTFPRVMSFPFNIPGSIFLIGGALLSVWRFLRRSEFAYRMWANILIALGAILIAFVGSRARLGTTTGLYPAEMVASALLLAGFLMAGTLQKGRAAARDKRTLVIAGDQERHSDNGLPS
jgi:peptidoglycan/LPS O-acetylase OafA/YrhL